MAYQYPHFPSDEFQAILYIYRNTGEKICLKLQSID